MLDKLMIDQDSAQGELVTLKDDASKTHEGKELTFKLTQAQDQDDDNNEPNFADSIIGDEKKAELLDQRGDDPYYLGEAFNSQSSDGGPVAAQ